MKYWTLISIKSVQYFSPYLRWITHHLFVLSERIRQRIMQIIRFAEKSFLKRYPLYRQNAALIWISIACIIFPQRLFLYSLFIFLMIICFLYDITLVYTNEIWGSILFLFLLLFKLFDLSLISFAKPFLRISRSFTVSKP